MQAADLEGAPGRVIASPALGESHGDLLILVRLGFCEIIILQGNVLCTAAIDDISYG